MKVFFNASLTGRKEYLEHYNRINKAILSTDKEVVAAPVLSGDKAKSIEGDSKEMMDYYKKLQSWIRKADICVFEVSFPSTSIGHEIALALYSSKPVIALHVEGATKNLILETINDDRLQLIDYKLDDVENVVQDALDYASENMDTRFNFFISPQIGNYLDWISKNKKLPRAVFLRQLIQNDMKKQGYEG